MKEYKLTVIIYLIFTMLTFPLEAIAIPQIYSHFFEVLKPSTPIKVFVYYFVLLVFFLAIINGANSITTYIESYMLPNINDFFLNYIFKNLLGKYENNIESIELGKLITRLSVVPQCLRDYIVTMCVWIIPRFLTIIVINIYFFFINWKLGIVSFILLVLYFSINIFFFYKCSSLSFERHKLFEQTNEVTLDKLSNSFSIYSTGNLMNEVFSYKNFIKTYTNKFHDNLLCLNKSTLVNSVFNILLFVFLNSVSVYLYIRKELRFTYLIAIFITIIYYLPCLVTVNLAMPEVIHYYGTLSSADKFIQDLYNVEKNKLKENNELKTSLEIQSGNIVINNLNFGYKKNDKLLFNKFYLTIKNNERVAIVGSSGNGKSSLIKIVMGYYKVPNGTIYIDNTDINNYNLNDLRKQISYVNQNNKLFNKTLLENIQYGNNLSREEIVALCKKIDVYNVFKNLKDGLDTDVGVEGNNLSGGQRQLVHILRCICKKNKIVILDEPTSAIDKENKKNIIKAINELSKNCTLILITHDETILNLVDRVIILDAGKIISDKYIRK